MTWRADRDRGAAEALGLVLLAPFVILLAFLVVAMGRSVDSEAQMRTAAEAAAQAGALERSHAAAQSAAERLVSEMMADSFCTDASVAVPSDVSRGVGMGAGLIEVTLTCTMGNDGLEAVTQPVTRSVTAYATVDRFRAGGGG
jgi:Flp pilus assembly protein TadG